MMKRHCGDNVIYENERDVTAAAADDDDDDRKDNNIADIFFIMKAKVLKITLFKTKQHFGKHF